MPNREDRESKLSIRQKQDFVYRMKEKRREASLEENKELNEAPDWWERLKRWGKKIPRGKDIDKNSAGDYQDALASIKREVGKEGETYDFYTLDGKKIPYQTYASLPTDQQLACIVVDSRGYFVRKGTEVLIGDKVKAKMTLDGKLSTADETNKVSDAHKAVENKLEGRPADWEYFITDGSAVKEVDGSNMFDENGKLKKLPDGWTIQEVHDTKGNVLSGQDKILTVVSRFIARMSDAQKASASDSKSTESDGKKITKKHIWKGKPSDIEGGKIKLDKLSNSNELLLTEKQFNALSISRKRFCYFGVENGTDEVMVYSYQQAVASSGLKKLFKLTESRTIKVDDKVMSLNESYTPARKGVDYDDSFETEPTDTKYNFDYKIDDTFG